MRLGKAIREYLIRRKQLKDLKKSITFIWCSDHGRYHVCIYELLVGWT